MQPPCSRMDTGYPVVLLLYLPSVLLMAEGPRDAKSCRGTCVATSSSTRPCGLLLQTSSSGVVGPYMRPIAIAPMGREQPGGQRIQALPCISSFLLGLM